MLSDYPKLRKYLYVIFTLATLVVGAFQVAYNSVSEPNPEWLTIALNVVPFVGAQLGLIALSNTPPKQPTV